MYLFKDVRVSFSLSSAESPSREVYVVHEQTKVSDECTGVMTSWLASKWLVFLISIGVNLVQSCSLISIGVNIVQSCSLISIDVNIVESCSLISIGVSIVQTCSSISVGVNVVQSCSLITIGVNMVGFFISFNFHWRQCSSIVMIVCGAVIVPFMFFRF